MMESERKCIGKYMYIRVLRIDSICALDNEISVDLPLLISNRILKYHMYKNTSLFFKQNLKVTILVTRNILLLNGEKQFYFK